MNRRNFFRYGLLISTGFLAHRALAQAMEQIGTMTLEQFEAVNLTARMQVAEVESTATPLSPSDRALLLMMSQECYRQLLPSRLAMKKALDPEVRAYAEAEVEEQLGLRKKITEISRAKDLTLPEEPDANAMGLVETLQDLKGRDFDITYLQRVGVDGHRMLLNSMAKVETGTSDPTLRAVAAATLPLIRMHLDVANVELKEARG